MNSGKRSNPRGKNLKSFCLQICRLVVRKLPFASVPFRDRKGGYYFSLCIGAAAYLLMGLCVIHIVGIFKAMFRPNEDGVVHLILLVGDFNLLKHLVAKIFLVGERRDGKYSIFAATPMLLSFQQFTQRRGQALEVQENPRPGLNVISVEPDPRPVATQNTPLM